MKKKIISTIIVLGLLCLSFGAFAPSGNVAEAASVTSWIKKGVFYVLEKGANNWYTVKANTSTGPYGATVTPGTLNFNSGKIGASVKFNIAAQSTKHSLSVYALSSPVNLGKKLSIIVTNPKGNDTINTSVNPGQYKGFKFGLTGTYVARFVINNSWKAAPYVGYRYDDAYKTYGTRSMLDTDSQPDTEVEVVQTENYGDLIEPEFSKQVEVSNTNGTINIKDLLTLMTDDNGNYAVSIRNYDVGDTIKFSDQIYSLEYDSENNNTELFFESQHNEEDYLKFKGDLTKDFVVGDTFTIDMVVESLSEGNELKMPSYYKYLMDNENEAPELVLFN